MPDSFYRAAVKQSLGYTLGPIGSYGTGIVFLPHASAGVAAVKSIFEAQVIERGFKVIGWRKIETGARIHTIRMSYTY